MPEKKEEKPVKPVKSEPRKNWLKVEISEKDLASVAEACGSVSAGRDRLETALAGHLATEVKSVRQAAALEQKAELEKQIAALNAALEG